MAHLGIDLGTSNTLAAYFTADKLTLARVDGRPAVPSVISFDEESGLPIVGETALDLWAEPEHDPTHVFRRWKLKMGENALLGVLTLGQAAQKTEISPEMLTTLLVEYIVDKISKDLGGEPIESILVTVPHGWRRAHAEKCRATRQAAAQAKIGKSNIPVQPTTLSEPVAAAAYWIWEHQRARVEGNLSTELEGHNLLVCDMGGGTFDLSLIRAGASGRTLDVLDAANNDCGGDYVDALLCAWVCRQFNERFQVSYPVTAEDVLKEIGLGKSRLVWLRRWLVDAQRSLKQPVSERVLRPGKRFIPVKASFTDAEGNSLRVELSLEKYLECLQPFFEQGRDLLRGFLSRMPHPLYATVFCGGGSRIAGVREHIVAPVLGEIYGDEAESVLNRIAVNPQRVDEAIALGAALVANGQVSVQENLLYDIGLAMSVENEMLANALGLPKDDPVFVLSPALSKGTPLPATVSNTQLAITSTRDKNELRLSVYIFDNVSNPWVQIWTLPQSDDEAADWALSVDTDGVLTFTLQPGSGEMATVSGQVERQRKQQSSMLIAGPRQDKRELRLISPAMLRETISKLKP